MRIAFFTDSFYPELGGIQDALELVARHLASRGHHIDIFAPQYCRRDYAVALLPQKELNLGPNISLHRIPSISLPSPTLQSRLALPTSVMPRKAPPPNVIHTHTFGSLGLYAIAAAKCLRIPLIGTNHTAIKAFAAYFPFSAQALSTYVLWFFNRCNLVSAPSRSVFDDLGRHRILKPLHIVPNPVDVELFHPGGEQSRYHAKKQLGFSSKTIIYAGRLAAEKNVDLLIRAVTILKKTFPSILLAVAGHGSAEADLRALVEQLNLQNHVKFLGTLTKPLLAHAFQAADLFATMSTSETQCLALFQAMAAGLPVVCANSRALSEFISDQIGILIRSGNYYLLAERVAQLFGDEQELRRLSKNAESFAAHFTAAHIGFEWECLYGQMLGTPFATLPYSATS